MAKNFYESLGRLSLAQQLAGMEREFPGLKAHWECGKIVWTGPLSPTPMSETYIVSISYTLGLTPKVKVLSPKLVGRPDEDIPHMYSQTFLCLFYPRNREWTPRMLISESIARWTMLWLYHYEQWHITGNWQGGGKHPPGRRRNRNRRTPLQADNTLAQGLSEVVRNN